MQRVQGFSLSLGNWRDVGAAWKGPESDKVAASVLERYLLRRRTPSWEEVDERSLGPLFRGTFFKTAYDAG